MRTGRDSFEEAQPCPSPWPGAASGDIPTGEMTPRGRAGWLPSALLLLQLPGRWLSPSCGRGGCRAGAGSTFLSYCPEPGVYQWSQEIPGPSSFFARATPSRASPGHSYTSCKALLNQHHLVTLPLTSACLSKMSHTPLSTGSDSAGSLCLSGAVWSWETL